MKSHIGLVLILLMIILIIATVLFFASPSYADDLIVTGHLIDLDSDAPACGALHIGSVAVYDDITVIKGTYSKDTLYVIHGCIEMGREEYAKDSGSLKTFTLHDYHKLNLSTENIYEIEIHGEEITMKDKGFRLFYSRTVDPINK